MAKQFDNLNKGAQHMGGLSGLINGNKETAKQEQAPQKLKQISWVDVPASVHRFLKLKATDESISMSNLILEAVVTHYGIDKD